MALDRWVNLAKGKGIAVGLPVEDKDLDVALDQWFQTKEEMAEAV